MKYVILAAAAAAVATAAPAFAQDAPSPGTFSGVYIGVAGGYDVQPNDGGATILFDRDLNGGFGDSVTTSGGANAFSPGFCGGRAQSGVAPITSGVPCRNDRDGWAYYGRVGVDRQIGHFVIGAVGEFGKSEITDSVSGFSTTPASYTLTRSIDWEAGARLRGGFVAGDSTLFYATGGAGYARINRFFETTNTANAFSQRGRRDQFGYQAGGGVEQRIGRHFSFGLEYLYHQYNDDDYRVRAFNNGSTAATNPFLLGNTAGTDFRRSDEKFRWHSMRATAAFRF